MDCDHRFYKFDNWSYWICERCGKKKNNKEMKEEFRQSLIKFNKKLIKWGYKGKPVWLK